MEPTLTDDLISTKEASRLLGLAVATLESKRVRPNGSLVIPFYKIGKSVRYKRGEILAIIEAGRRFSTTDPGSEANK